MGFCPAHFLVVWTYVVPQAASVLEEMTKLDRIAREQLFWCQLSLRRQNRVPSCESDIESLVARVYYRSRVGSAVQVAPENEN